MYDPSAIAVQYVREDMKKTLNILKNIFVWTLIVCAVLMMIFTLISVRTFDRNDRSIFGYKAYTVLSDSMSATDFDAGSIVFVKEVEDPATLKPGDIIAFISQNEGSNGEVFTHKIRELTLVGNEPAFVTYGTTNNINDEKPVTYPYVMGKYEFHISYIGHFFEFLKTTPGYITCIFLPFALLMLYNGINCVRLFRRYKKEQYAELEEEKRKIAAEREENARVLAELRALKQQMEGGVSTTQTPAPTAPAEAAATPVEAPATAPVEATTSAPAAAPATAVKPESEPVRSTEAASDMPALRRRRVRR